MGEGKEKANGESNIEVYTRPCVKKITCVKLLYNTGNPVWRSDNLERCDEREVVLKRETIYIYIYG